MICLALLPFNSSIRTSLIRECDLTQHKEPLFLPSVIFTALLYFPNSFGTTTAGLFSFYSSLTEMQAGDIAVPVEKATFL